MCELFESLLKREISSTEFRHWFNTSGCEVKSLQKTTKYDLMTYLLTNIRSSTQWLSAKESSRVEALDTSGTNVAPIGVGGGPEEDSVGHERNDTSMAAKSRPSLMKKTSSAVNVLSKRIETIDICDEKAFPGLSCPSTGVADGQKTTVLNNGNNSRRTKRIKPTTIKADDRISVGFFMTGRKDSPKTKTFRNDRHKGVDNLVLRANPNETMANITAIGPKDTLSAEREWLKKAKAVNEVVAAKTSLVSGCDKPNTTRETTNRLAAIEADHRLVTCVEQLDVISTVYTCVLSANCLPNVFEELKFVCDLIARPVYRERVEEEDIRHEFDRYFSSYHNCCHFGINCLKQLLTTYGMVCCLNRTLLRQMAESSVLATFEPLFAKQLLEVLAQKCVDNRRRGETFATTLESVSYQSETDNKNHFPNDNSFHVFRRQRDEFYNIFNAYRSQWSGAVAADGLPKRDSSVKFTAQVKHLLSMSSDSANVCHLSRLFVAQLMQSCVHKRRQSSPVATDADDSDTIGQLSADRERLQKLRKRFHQSATTGNGGCESSTVFTKEEQFFRDFIFSCDSHAFNENLKPLLCDKIVALCHEFDDTDTCDEDRDAGAGHTFVDNVFALKILSKFLGFTHFYPFATQLSKGFVCHEFVDHQRRLRCLQTRPAIDFERRLLMAVRDGRLVAHIPWITEYLSFIDPISARIDYYQNIYQLLVDIYRRLVPEVIATVPTNGYLLMSCMTRIVSHKSFDFENRFYKIVFDLDTVLRREDIDESGDNRVKRRLDSMADLIDGEVLAEFYPHLNSQLNAMFKQMTVLSGGDVKRIMPLRMSATKLKTKDETIDSAEKRLRFQVAEQFFNSHSPSLKKTVDFVADRITSKAIRRVRAEVFVESKKPFVEELNVNDGAVDYQRITDAIHRQCVTFVDEYCVEQIKAVFPLLLNEDVDECVAKFAQTLALRMASEKCYEWLAKNITETLVESDLKCERRMCETTTDEPKEPVLDISPTFSAIRDLMADLYRYESMTVEASTVGALVHDLAHLRRSRCLSKKTKDFIDVNVLDFAMALISRAPKLVDAPVVQLFIDYWREFDLKVDKYICPRNLYILSHRAISQFLCWHRYETVLLALLANGLTDDKAIEADLLWTVKQEWSEPVLQRLASCLKSVSQYLKATGKTKAGHVLDECETIDWLSWLCSQSEH